MKRTPIERRTPMRRVALKRAAALVRSRKVPDPIPPLVRMKVKLRSDWHCEMCGVDLFPGTHGEMSHRQPRGMGGGTNPDRHSPANLLYACADCHRDVESNRSAAYLMGRLVRRGYDPRHMPVLIHRHGWVLLTDDGSMKEVPAVGAR